MVESSESDFMSSSGYKTSRTGFTIGTEFEQKNNLFVNLESSNLCCNNTILTNIYIVSYMNLIINKSITTNNCVGY